MQETINSAFSQFIATKQDIIDNIVNNVNSSTSQLIEILGQSGTGKSFIFKKLAQSLENRGLTFCRFVPRNFSFNHLKDILMFISVITEEDFSDIVSKAQGLKLENRYDFFYFLTETLNRDKKFKPNIVLIDNGYLIDEYTRDFIQYLVQYAAESGMHFVVFTTRELFIFSQKVYLEYLSSDNIRQVLQEIIDTKEETFIAESEILRNITGGNIYMLEYIIKELIPTNTISKLDLSNYLDKKIDVEAIYQSRLSKLSESQLETLEYIYLLDGYADEEHLNKVLKHQKEISLKEMISFLKEAGFISSHDKGYYLRKVVPFQNYFMQKNAQEKKKQLAQTAKLLQSENVFGNHILKYYIELNEYLPTLVQDSLVFLTDINDHEAQINLLSFCLEHTSDPIKQISFLTKLGITNKRFKRLEVAAENFRQALRLCTANNQPAEEVVYCLSECLYAMNSSAYALEVIKKFSPATIDIFWKCKLYLLKAEILMETEEFHEAIIYIDDAFQEANQIDDKQKRYYLQAESKKIKGKIYYFNNQWEKSEITFREAESLYKIIGYLAGMAAVFNNIGVLKMFQGDWSSTEQLYLASLELEKQRYCLDGISICYNNLGGLSDDQGDYKKSLYYLNEALKIQKLLSERYNISNCYNNIGVTCMDNGEFEKAAEAFEKSLSTAMSFNLYKNVIASLNNLGGLYFKSGNWSKAKEYYESSIEKSNENNFMEGLLRSYNNLGELYEKRGEYTLAYNLYFKGQEIVPLINDDYVKAELYGNLGSVLTHLHSFGEAYAYLVESFDFFKSLNAKEKIIECCQKQAFYFIQTRNYESADYYLNLANKTAKELNNRFELGKILLLRAQLEKKDKDKAKKILEETIQIFLETKNHFELALTNYEYAALLNETEDWEQALQILNNNRKIIQKYGAIKFLEQNDTLIQKISKDHAIELKESKSQENLFNKFYEITAQINSFTDFDLLLESSLNSMIDLSEADGGMLCLYNSRSLPDSWEYKIFNHFSMDDKDYDSLMDLIQTSFKENKGYNYKQPHFAPHYNDIITLTLAIRNKIQGVILLFSKHGSHYFSDKLYNLLSALCNQIVVIIENIRHSNLEKSHAIIREELNTSSVFTNIVGKNKKMIDIFELIEKIKDTPTSVLLEGPSGTGKELIARAIHYNSNRRNKKFVAQYCGALPETLLESELFGHVKGSFTGAAYDKKGLFEIADGGTFFLDEIADISLSTQAKLLRFLQEGEIKRVGSTKTETVDVRVVCATNVSLSEKVKKGEFRLDLYYRLNVIRIDVPSLKERKSDIPLLAIHFLDKYNKKMNKRVIGITDEAMKYLLKCDWPGNIRHLENEIERAVTLAEPDSFIRPSDLSEEIFKYDEHTETINLLQKLTLKEAVDNLEKQMIQRVLDDRNWNQTTASKDLGLSRQGLIKKMKRYNLENN